MVVPLPKALFHHDKMSIHVIPAFFLKNFFSKFGKWANVGFPSDEDRKGKRCLSEYKLDTPMSSLAKDELSVSMVTRSSLSYGYPLTSLWSYFLLYSRPYRHTHTHTCVRRHTLPNAHRFSFHPPCPCCFFYHIFSPLPLCSILHHCFFCWKWFPVLSRHGLLFTCPWPLFFSRSLIHMQRII